MRIICGTDFSERGRQAAEIAALLAARAGGRMTLLHALDARGGGLGAAQVLQALEAAARERLDEQARHLRTLGAPVDIAMPDGWPDEALLGEAARHDDSIVVLAATGARDGAGVSVGKTCERTLSRTSVPMLVIRDPAPLNAWLRAERPLRILVAFDFSPQSASALAFAARLSRLAPCEIVAAFTSDPKREATRMGLHDAPESAQEHLRAALANRVSQLEPELPVDVLVAPHHGDPGGRLAHLAEREGIDLVISGTHQRGALQRLFAGSVSLHLLRDAATNLIVVPTIEAAAATAALAPRELRRVLVATDLSETGNRAVFHALAFAPAGSEIKIIHIMSPNQMLDGAYGRASYSEFASEHAAARANRERALQALMPPLERVAHRTIRHEVVENDRPARAIIEQAEQFDADLICLGTLGRSGLAAALLGSIAQEVLRLCRRPLLLVPPAERV